MTDPKANERQTKHSDPNQSSHGSSSDTMAPGTKLDGRYLIDKELGRGGIGVVYLARDQKLHDSPVVIKALHETLPVEQKDWFEKKFRTEIAALARINHPGVVRALDVGELPNRRSYLVMQYVAGGSLRSIMTSNGIEFARAASLIRQIGQALAAAHGQDVIHRDLKPENIMLQRAGDEEYVKIIDFGIATVQESPTSPSTSTIVGTVPYMSPEQLRGRPTKASDTYAMGVIAYELLTGRLPFYPESPYQLLELQKLGVRLLPGDLRQGLPPAAQSAILKALSYNQQERYERADEFGEALSRALTTKIVDGPSPVALELANVLFTDLVGYSTLTIDEQARLLGRLQLIVSSTESFQQAQLNNQLLCLPTGDGMALVFFVDPVAAVKCAVEVAQLLKQEPEIKLRMGIHTGPVKRIADINQNMNVSGGGINMAQRVMECGEAGHILVSQNVADVLQQLRDWSPHLQDWGEHKVKHGIKVHIFNLRTSNAGNSDLPAKLRHATISSWTTHKSLKIGITALAAVVAIVIAAIWFISPRWGTQNGVVGTTATLAQEPRLKYSLTVRRDPRRYPGSKQFEVAGEEMIFSAGDHVKLNISSTQDGYLYVINEGPMQSNALPDFNILFPEITTNSGSAAINANQQIQIPQAGKNPDEGWFIFDQEEGVEKIWLAWSEQSVPELEDIKMRANPTDRGVVADAREIQALSQYLTKNSATSPEVEKDKDHNILIFKGRGKTIVVTVRLQHR